MPFIPVNGISLYYEAFGVDQPGRAPVVLIHGSTLTGRADWQTVASLLATRYRVIVPDCRGHGRSEGTHSYTFRELAADTAVLIRALGYPRAHLIGHSNGGNVVLVTLLEHPEVVQTCIPQAANAYVSQDLIDRKPALFDPERVAREAPAWRDEMIELHGAAHGVDYWRELLKLTVDEIIRAPNYSPDRLAQVHRPVLVIQGELDRVNAPMRHAQFIAQHIPQAELWIPAGIGHNVHLDAPLDWLTHVLDFLERRGDDVNDALYRLKRQHYADARATIFDVHYDAASQTATGDVLTPDQRRAARRMLSARRDQIRVLLTDDAPWALVNRPVADVRRAPRSDAEQITQLLIGEAVRVLDEQDNWAQVRLERDGYLGWARANSLFRLDQRRVRQYQRAASHMIAIPLAQAHARPSPRAPLIGQLPFTVSLPQIEVRGQFAALRLPDDRVWWVKAADVLSRAQRPRPTRSGIPAALDRIRQLIDVPYLWGGCSPFGYDCSGLAQAFYRFMGVPIPRDADQQFAAGVRVTGEPQPGDLLFFSGDDADLIDARRAHITHVAISLGGDELIHANGHSWSTAYNSLNPASPIHRAWLKDHLAGVRRFR